VEAARTADAVCFGTLAQRCAESRRTILTVLSAAPAGALKVLDINLRQNFFSAPLIENSLKGANVLKLNDEELTRLAPLLGLRGSETEMLQQLTVRYPLSCIALTKGARGSVLYSGTGERVERPARRVTVQDTVGAGDAYAAALTLGLLRRHSFTHILEDAHALAEYVCTRSGATPPIPAELRSRFAA
jgi:fructokinase